GYHRSVLFEFQRGTSPAGLAGWGSLGTGEGRGGVEDCGSGRSVRGGGFTSVEPGWEEAFASVAAGGAGTGSGRVRSRVSASARCSLRGASCTRRCNAFLSEPLSPRFR